MSNCHCCNTDSISCVISEQRVSGEREREKEKSEDFFFYENQKSTCLHLFVSATNRISCYILDILQMYIHIFNGDSVAAELEPQKTPYAKLQCRECLWHTPQLTNRQNKIKRQTKYEDVLLPGKK